MREHLLGPFIRRFLLEEVVADRNLSPNTQRSYRDAIRLLLGFMAERHATDPTQLTVEQVTAEVVRAFLAHLEDERGNSVATRNQRLASIHSLFRFIGRQVPELVEQATQIQTICRRSRESADFCTGAGRRPDMVFPVERLTLPETGNPPGIG